MLYEIKNRFTGAVIHSTEGGSLRAVVLSAIASGANLSRAKIGGSTIARKAAQAAL